MNTIRVIDFVLDVLPEPLGDIMESAQEHLRGLVLAYDALAPDWSKAPEGTTCYSIDADGRAWWSTERAVLSVSVWAAPGGSVFAKQVKLPVGIDWRECCWSRP